MSECHYPIGREMNRRPDTKDRFSLWLEARTYEEKGNFNLARAEGNVIMAASHNLTLTVLMEVRQAYSNERIRRLEQRRQSND